MNHDNLYFHNTVALPPAPGGGLHISRFFPEILDQAETDRGMEKIRSSNGCEIRLVTTRPSFRVYLRSLANDSQLVVLIGNQIHQTLTLPAGGIHGLEINLPAKKRNITEEAIRLGGFAPDVIRIHSLEGYLAYHGFDPLGGTVRPPTKEEMPRRRWLAYGSSITQAGQIFHNYVNTATQMLEVDAFNLGMAGSCHIEPAVGDFIAGREDWDFASFELGVNMRGPSTTQEEFQTKVTYLLDKVTAAHPEKPIFLITHFCNEQHFEKGVSETGRDQAEKDRFLRETAARYSRQVTLIEGTDIAPDLRGFKTDLLHPEPFAFVRMGLNLADAMAAVLKDKL